MTSISNIINRSRDLFSSGPFRYFSLFSLISLALYAASLTYPFFIFDDYINIARNPKVPPETIQDFFFFWADSNTPLAYNFWQLLSLIAPNNMEMGLRVVNILTHSINSVLVLYIFRLLWPQNVRFDNRLSFSMFAALIFCLHPTHVESIVWVSNSRGVMATFLFLLALWRYLVTRSSDKYFDVTTFLLFMGACLIKPSTIVFPAFLFFIERYVYQSNIKKAFFSFHYYIYPVIGLAFIHIKDLISLNFYDIPIYYRLFNSLQSLQHYFIKTFFPIGLKFNYQLGPYQLLENEIQIPSLVLTGLFSLFFFYFLTRSFFAKKIEKLEFFIALFFISVFPTIGFFPFDFQNISTVSDRYHYLAIIPFSWLVANLIKKRSIQIFILIIFSLISYKRVIDWHSQELILTDGRELKNLNHHILSPLVRVWSGQGHCKKIYNLQFEIDSSFFLESENYLFPLYSCIQDTGHYKIARRHARQRSVNATTPELMKLLAEVYLTAGLIDKFYYQANQLATYSPKGRNNAFNMLVDARQNWDQQTKELYIQLHNQYLIHNETAKSQLFIDSNRILFTDKLLGLEDELYQKQKNFMLFHEVPSLIDK